MRQIVDDLVSAKNDESPTIQSAWFAKILTQALCSSVYDVVKETPLERAGKLSDRLHNDIFLKREDVQPVFSFKCRGAYQRLSKLSEQERQTGVIAASAGNHAQGVALAAKALGIDATIVMPQTTPHIKVEAVQRLGSEALLYGDNYDDAFAKAQTICQQDGRLFIPPYDDWDVITGQATVALELLRQQNNQHLDAVFVPVGGGGLIAGITAIIKQVMPQTKVIGVEPVDSACLTAALQADERVVLPSVGIFADGVAVKQVGQWPFDLCRGVVDDMVTVSTDEICAGIKDIFEDTRAIAEPAGALAVAGAKKYIAEHDHCRGKKLALVVSGANMNFDRLRHIAERTEVGEKREAIFAVTIDERPGAFREFCEVLGAKRAITEFNYRFSDPYQAEIFVGVQLQHGDQERQTLLKTLLDRGLSTVDLTDDELAKVHLRYMVGGKSPLVKNERLVRFRFPERPGALLNFLQIMNQKWNISLFHYRNHGSAEGRVLAGVQVPQKECDDFSRYLASLGYPYHFEDENEGYQRFLKPFEWTDAP